MTNRVPSRRRAAPGFTLIELMVSIAIVLVLILGVNTVFKIASDAVGAGDAYSTASRDNRSVQSVIASDFRSMVVEGAPFIVITSAVQPAFRNSPDQQADRDFNPNLPGILQQQPAILTVDNNGDGREGASPGETISPAYYNHRNHRVDGITFFASGVFRRQTGDVGQFVSPRTSYEAFIHYGHLRLHDGTANTIHDSTTGTNGDGAYPNPGIRPRAAAAEPNPYNFFATDWVLGRSQVLLVEGMVAPPTSGVLPPGVEHHQRDAGTGPPGELAPLSHNSLATVEWGTGQPIRTDHSRFDLANTSIAQIKDQFAFNVNTAPVSSGGEAWWPWVNYRFCANVHPTRPIEPADVAQTSPLFLRGCTQFIVEFAGDYLTQQNDPTVALYGNILTPGAPDGVIDYVVWDPPGAAPPIRQTRWYGMPRDNDGDGQILAAPDSPDVLPVRDVAGIQVFERALPPVPSGSPPDYMKSITVANLTATSPALQYVYTAAWTPADLAAGSTLRPRLFRITITVDDPAGRMAEGQTFEYVIEPGL